MDKRILGSEQKLKDTFKDLMRENDPADITVKRLCAEAGLNRSTFYDRFGYIENLIRAIIYECMEAVLGASLQTVANGMSEKAILREDVRSYVARFSSDKLLMHFSKSKQHDVYLDMMIEAQAKIAMESILDSVDYYPAYFHSVGTLGLLLEWINKGKDVPEEQIVDIIQEYSKGLYREYRR